MTDGTTSGRSVVVTPEILGATVRDLTMYLLLRVPMILLGVFTLICVALAVFLISRASTGEIELRWEYWVFPLLLLGFVIAVVVSSYRTISKSEHAIMPVGSTLEVEVRENHVIVTGPQGTSRMQFSAYSGSKLMRDTVILRVKGTSMVQGIPRVLLSEADITRLAAI